MKSRQQNYFHPVKELLNEIDRRRLSQKFFEFHKTLAPSDDHVFRDNTFMEGVWRDANAGSEITLEDFKKRYLEVTDMHDIPCFARFYRISDYDQLRNDKEISDLLVDIIDSYGASKTLDGSPAVAFLHTWGKQNVLARHTDPGGIAKITIPLYPDYGSYRNLNFYETTDEREQPNPSYTVNYSEIRSPVLLDVSKVHEIESSQSEESLCIQFTFNKGYKSARNLLSKKGLLKYE